VLIDNGTHSLDIARYFLGPLREINVVEGKRIKGSPVEDAVHVFARNENGVPANIDLSWSISKELDYYVRIYGSTGTISLGWKESKIRTKVGGPWEVFGAGYQRDAALAAQVENFIGAIRGDEPLCITTDDALASVRAVEAAYTALRASDSRWTLLEGSVARVAETNGKPASNGSGTLIGV
jgi:predicted dehydrogenase